MIASFNSHFAVEPGSFLRKPIPHLPYYDRSIPCTGDADTEQFFGPLFQRSNKRLINIGAGITKYAICLRECRIHPCHIAEFENMLKLVMERKRIGINFSFVLGVDLYDVLTTPVQQCAKFKPMAFTLYQYFVLELPPISQQFCQQTGRSV